jgi:hypothetical protein
MGGFVGGVMAWGPAHRRASPATRNPAWRIGDVIDWALMGLAYGIVVHVSLASIPQAACLCNGRGIRGWISGGLDSSQETTSKFIAVAKSPFHSLTPVLGEQTAQACVNA